MLHKIRIENFFSIADSQELYFGVPGNAPDLPCFRKPYADDVVRLPTVIGFFGPNASGKTTVLRAIMSAARFVLHSFDWNNDEINEYFRPYRQKDWWGKPTKITIEFDSRLSDETSPARFRYELHISHQANEQGNKSTLYEALSYAPKGKFRRLFEREGQQFSFGSDFGISTANDQRKESIRANASVISTLAKLNHSPSIYLSQLIAHLPANTFGFEKIQQTASQWLSAYAKDKTCLERLNRELRRLDVGLESMTVEQGDRGLFARFKHVGLDGPIILGEESAGTRRFIEVFPLLHYALEIGSIAIIDEIDTDFHPLLLPKLFRWFSDLKRNPHNAQLLFTAHNPALLDDLEKEQIFLVEKTSGQATCVYGVRDIKGLRREPSLMKKYLAGELGAVPHIG